MRLYSEDGFVGLRGYAYGIAFANTSHHRLKYMDVEVKHLVPIFRLVYNLNKHRYGPPIYKARE